MPIFDGGQSDWAADRVQINRLLSKLKQLHIKSWLPANCARHRRWLKMQYGTRLNVLCRNHQTPRSGMTDAHNKLRRIQFNCAHFWRIVGNNNKNRFRPIPPPNIFMCNWCVFASGLVFSVARISSNDSFDAYRKLHLLFLRRLIDGFARIEFQSMEIN